MLVLTRKLMEKLYIGDDVCVTVVRLEGGQVRLGIEAPRDVAVVRAELVPERECEAASGPRFARGRDAEGPAGGVRRPPVSAHGTDSPRRERSR